jgi:hypothetical protein
MSSRCHELSILRTYSYLILSLGINISHQLTVKSHKLVIVGFEACKRGNVRLIKVDNQVHYLL